MVRKEPSKHWALEGYQKKSGGFSHKSDTYIAIGD